MNPKGLKNYIKPKKIFKSITVLLFPLIINTPIISTFLILPIHLIRYRLYLRCEILHFPK